jgi:hypothetical protein
MRLDDCWLSGPASGQDRVAIEMPRCFIAAVGSGPSRRSLDPLEGGGLPAIRIEPSGRWPSIDRPDLLATGLLGFPGSLPEAPEGPRV